LNGVLVPLATEMQTSDYQKLAQKSNILFDQSILNTFQVYTRLAHYYS